MLHARREGLLTIVVFFGVFCGVAGVDAQEKGAQETSPATLHLRPAEEVPLMKAVPGAREVEAALEARDWEKAKELVGVIEKKSPDDPLALILVVRVYRWGDSLFAVRKQMARALELAPNDPRVLCESVKVRLWDDGVTPALKQGQEALKAHPNSACLLKLVGDFHNAKGEYPEAIAVLEGPAKGLREPEGRAGVYQALAEAYLGDMKHELAIKAIDETLKLRPGDAEALVVRGDILEATGHWQGAYETLLGVKREPGKFEYDKRYLHQLDKRIAELKPKVLAIKAKELRQDPEKVILLGKAYQARPTDQKARDAFAAHMLDLCEVIGSDSIDPAIEVKDEKKPGGPGAMPGEEVIGARTAAEKMIAGDVSIMYRYNSHRNYAQVLPELEKAVSVYPSSDTLYMLAMIHFQDKRFHQAAYYAALSSGVSSLEAYQLGLKEEEDAFAVIEKPYVWSRRLALEAIRFRDGATTPDDRQLAEYLKALAEEDWVRLQQVFVETSRSKTWASSKNPVAWSAQMSHFRHREQIEKALVAKGREYLRQGKPAWVKTILGLLDGEIFTSPEAQTFCVMAWKEVGDAGEYKKALDKALEKRPYDPEIRYALGLEAEKAGNLQEAMLQYNAGARGQEKKSLPAIRQANAISRDGIEARLGSKYEEKYTGYIDGERKAKVIPRERRAVISAGVSRLIGKHPKNAVLYMVRSEEAYRMGEYEACIADAEKATSLKRDLLHQSEILIGDSNYQLSKGKHLTGMERNGYLSKAVEGYTKALESAPAGSNGASLFFARGMRCVELQRSDEAFKDITKATELFDDKVKNKAWAYLQLSKLWEAKGEKEKAREQAARAWELAKVLWPGSDGPPREFEARVKLLSGAQGVE